MKYDLRESGRNKTRITILKLSKVYIHPNRQISMTNQRLLAQSSRDFNTKIMQNTRGNYRNIHPMEIPLSLATAIRAS